MNTSGQRVSEALMTLQEAVRDPMHAERMPPGFVDEGEIWCDELADIVHGDEDPRQFDVDGMRLWLRNAWDIGGQIETMDAAVLEGEDPNAVMNQMNMGRWINESGLSEDEAVQIILEATRNGDPMPWEKD
jgi:hypothetical protein